jgi:hypothetical protein
MKQTPASGVNGGATRRDFLKTGGGGHGRVLGGLHRAQRARRGSDVIRVGMIGCGPRCTGAAAERSRRTPARASSP